MRGGSESPHQLLPVLLDESLRFPSLNGPLVEIGPSGLVAIGGDLSVARLVKAYASGIFPWSVNPITWWSPYKRGIIEFNRFHISSSLARVLRQKPFIVTANKAFRQVITGCADAHRTSGCWISPEFIESYTALHEAGYAHSVECWQEEKLVGGVYGVMVNGTFSAESMFYRADNASKVALVHLVRALQQSGCEFVDIQTLTPTTVAFGAIEISREDYLLRFKKSDGNPALFDFDPGVR